jgi:hypothetical protein
VFAPLVRSVTVLLSLSVKTYPRALFVLTVTVSPALLTTPPDVGVKVTVTVPLVVMLIAEPTFALMVVFAVLLAAEAITGSVATASDVTIIPARMRRWVVAIDYFFLFLFLRSV